MNPNGQEKKEIINSLLLEGANVAAERFGGTVEKWRAVMRKELGSVSHMKTEDQIRIAVNGAIGRVFAHKNSGNKEPSREYKPDARTKVELRKLLEDNAELIHKDNGQEQAMIDEEEENAGLQELIEYQNNQ